ADRNRSHWSTSKTPSYTKSVSWQHHHNIHPGQKQDLIHNITTFMLFRLCPIRFTGSENERQITL
ncbi:hypothetical protein, partial [Escherichia coli]|uniref:hypothetical protein n=1 Tax=Escherichia coli TaxID=562 RepID=UPI001FF61D3F